MLPQTIVWDFEHKTVGFLDQRRLPLQALYRDCRNYEEVARSIEDMTVRGAPAIGVAAAYGVALAVRQNPDLVDKAIERLAATRPTAANLFWALDRMKRVADSVTNKTVLPEILENEARKLYNEDIEINKKIGYNGQVLLPRSATVLTHCNAGALATAGYGTALGVLRAAREEGKELKIYVDETRPKLQGGRLTSFELYHDGFDVTVICDSMAAFLMTRVKIDAVITGADRIANNGDTANKIGTYGLAVAAKRHNVPFYIAAPISTVDFDCPDGGAIPLEERSQDEIKFFGNYLLVPEEVPAWNPAFDVTPAELITGIITEKGVFKPEDIWKGREQ